MSLTVCELNLNLVLSLKTFYLSSNCKGKPFSFPLRINIVKEIPIGPCHTRNVNSNNTLDKKDSLNFFFKLLLLCFITFFIAPYWQFSHNWILTVQSQNLLYEDFFDHRDFSNSRCWYGTGIFDENLVVHAPLKQKCSKIENWNF